MLQGQLAHVQVVADAKLPAKVGDVLERLQSKLLLSERVVLDVLLLFKAVDVDTNQFVFNVKEELEIDI